jgi:tripartite-type tricarboxylate transporter receptor subunit TctC
MPTRALVAALALLPLAAWSQAYPAKAITLLSGASVGSPGDVGVRIVAARMAESLGQPLVVESRRGAGGLEAYSGGAKAEPNGYTLLFANAGLVTNKFLRKSWPVDPVKDYTPVTHLFSSPYFLVSSTSVPANSLRELIDYAKKNPGKLTYASTGIGSGAHLQGEAINMAAGTQMLHVPYAGNSSAMAVNDIVTGRVDLYFADLNSVVQHANAGKVKLVGFVFNTRSPLKPDVPTIREVLPDAYNLVVWWGILGPTGLPRPIVDRINGEAGKVLSDASLSAKLPSVSVIPPSRNGPEEFARVIRGDYEAIGKVVGALGLKPE